MFKSTSVLVLCSILFAQATDADTIIYAGALIDGVSDAPRAEVSIVVAEGKFEAIEEGYIAPNPDDTVIDLREYTVMPGLMDMHVHLRIEHSKDSYTERFFMNPTDFALLATVYAERTLMAGFTTVRDAGGIDGGWAHAVASGLLRGPRMRKRDDPDFRPDMARWAADEREKYDAWVKRDGVDPLDATIDGAWYFARWDADFRDENAAG